MWFSINIAVAPNTGVPVFPTEQFSCVREVAKTIKEELNISVTHMICIGGWNAPHPTTAATPENVFEQWKIWNAAEIADGSAGFPGFAGIEWDIEGNEFVEEYRYFTVEVLDLMGELSQLFKSEGYLVSLVPAESYFNSNTGAFNRRLDN
jgi:hypothetical protein